MSEAIKKMCQLCQMQFKNCQRKITLGL